MARRSRAQPIDPASWTSESRRSSRAVTRRPPRTSASPTTRRARRAVGTRPFRRSSSPSSCWRPPRPSLPPSCWRDRDHQDAVSDGRDRGDPGRGDRREAAGAAQAGAAATPAATRRPPPEKKPPPPPPPKEDLSPAYSAPRKENQETLKTDKLQDKTSVPKAPQPPQEGTPNPKARRRAAEGGRAADRRQGRDRRQGGGQVEARRRGPGQGEPEERQGAQRRSRRRPRPPGHSPRPTRRPRTCSPAWPARMRCRR